ncbi:MAG: hypothetical protein ACI9B9_002472 [Halioglobus sp.]|jgi:hypothetical protein
MVRIIGIALVILGLIAQPLLAAVPDSMPIGESDQAVTASEQPSEMPCHEAVSPETAPEMCSGCDNDCANGACASACSLSMVATLSPSLFTFKLLSCARQTDYSGALVQEFPSRIFHPPKHA